MGNINILNFATHVNHIMNKIVSKGTSKGNFLVKIKFKGYGKKKNKGTCDIVFLSNKNNT